MSYFVIEPSSIGGCPLKEASEHYFLNNKILVVISYCFVFWVYFFAYFVFWYLLIDQEHNLSPFVVVQKKNGEWRICVDYREINKATQKDHFPLPFIDQVLDTLAGKKILFFPRWLQRIQSNSNCS